MRRIAAVATALVSLALFAACTGGGGNATPTGGVGGAEVTPPPTTAPPTTAPATPTAAGATAAASATPSGTPGVGMTLTIATPDDTRYSTNQLAAAAGAQVTLNYTNNSDLPHNWHLFNGADATAPSIAMTQIQTGPNAVETVTFTAPSTPGQYFFHCDVHPTIMMGILVVQ